MAADIECKLLTQMMTADGMAQVVEAKVAPDLFVEPAHRAIFEWMRAYRDESDKAPTRDAAEHEFPGRGLPDNVEESTGWLIGALRDRHALNQAQDLLRDVAKTVSDDPIGAMGKMVEQWQAVAQHTGTEAGPYVDPIAIADQVARLRVHEAARLKHAAEKDGPALPFDAGLLGEILARPKQPPYRFHDLLPSDGGLLVVAQRKTGKTTLTLNIAHSLITGEPLLGRFSTIPVAGRVALLNFEVSGEQVGRWANEVGIPHDRLLLVNLRGRRNPLGHGDDRRTLAELLRAHEVESLIVDPFGSAYNGASQNDPGEVRAWLDDLDAYARSEVGARDVILTAHAGWNGERTRGSSALEDWADSTVTMTFGTGVDSDSRFLRALGRDVSVEEDRMGFDPATRLLSLTGSGSRRQSSASVRVEILAIAICDYLGEHPGASFGDINKAIEGRQEDKRKAIEHAEGRGRLRREIGGSGKATKHFRADPIRPESPETDGIGSADQ